MTLERVSVAHREASKANTRVRGRCSREGRWHEREKGEREVKARLPLAWTSARLLHAFISNRSPSPFPPPRTCGSQFQVHRPRSGAGAVLIHVPHRTPIRSSAGLAVRCCFVACLLLRDSATCVSCRPFVPRLFVRKSREDRQQHPWLEELSVSLAPSPTCLSQSATAEENVHVAEAHALLRFQRAMVDGDVFGKERHVPTTGEEKSISTIPVHTWPPLQKTGSTSLAVAARRTSA